MTKIIAIQGEVASFHDIAAKKLFGDEIEIASCDNFNSTFETLKNSKAELALCAIENSLYGSINEVYDLVLKYDFKIVGEVYLRVEQCLIGFADTNSLDITKVYSHPIALAQCEEYLDTSLSHAERDEFYDTSASVRHIKELGEPTNAAIASKEAANLYGMEVLERSIETNKQNFTRFVALGKNFSDSTHNNKTSLILKTGHVSGALHAALGVFASRSINLTKLQSRPIIGKAWHYIFYIDLEISANDADFKDAVTELTKQECEVTILGSYITGQKPTD